MEDVKVFGCVARAQGPPVLIYFGGVPAGVADPHRSFALARVGLN
jgi:hypothetical protein